jgi:hypothetical protein
MLNTFGFIFKILFNIGSGFNFLNTKYIAVFSKYHVVYSSLLLELCQKNKKKLPAVPIPEMCNSPMN